MTKCFDYVRATRRQKGKEKERMDWIGSDPDMSWSWGEQRIGMNGYVE
jgi:hypothetical protein